MPGYDAFISYSHVDGDVARLVHRGLHQIARRPGQLRALNVFRDSTDLSASPDLWGNVVRAMDDSRYLVLILSPAAAASKWVSREVDHWVAHNSTEGVLMVLAGGELAWDQAKACFDPGGSSAAVSRLTEPGIFVHEPLYIDLRKAASSHPDSMFLRERITELAAPMHGKSKGELFSEDVRELRRFRTLRRAAVIALACLLVATSVAAGVAVHQRAKAIGSRDEAIRQRNQAQAVSLASASSATAQTNAGLSLALAAESAHALPGSVMTQSALLEARLRFDAAPVIPRPLLITSVLSDDSPIAVSPDGRLVAASAADSSDSTVGVWDTSSGAQVAKFPVPSRAEIEALTFTPDGSRLAIGTSGGLHVLNLVGGGNIQVSTRETTSVAFNPTRPLVAVCDSQGIRIDSTRGDFRTVATVLTRPRPAVGEGAEEIGRVTFSHDGRRLAAFFGSGRVLTALLRDHTLARVRERRIPDTYGVALSPRGQNTYVAAQDSIREFSYGVRDWRMRSDDGGWWGDIAISADGKVVVADNGDKLSMWDADGSALGTVQGDGTEFDGLAISADSNVMATRSTSGVRLWDLDSDLQVTGNRTRVDDNTVTARWAGAFAFMPGGSTIAATSSTGVRFMAPSGKQATHYTMGDQAALTPAKLREIRSMDQTPGDPSRAVSSIAISPDLFATLHEDDTDKDTISTWQPKTQKLLTRGFPEMDYDGGFAVAPRGSALAAADRQGTVRVWNGATARLKHVLHSPDGDLTWKIAFSPDGRSLAVSYSNGSVGIWNLSTGRLRRSIDAAPQGETTVAWRPDGSLLAVGGMDGRVRLFEARSGRLTGTFLAGDAIVEDLAFRPDGQWLAAGALNTITFWDVDNRRLLGSTPALGVQQVAFAPDGTSVAASDDSGLTLWRNLWNPQHVCEMVLPFVSSQMIQPYLPPGWRPVCHYKGAKP